MRFILLALLFTFFYSPAKTQHNTQPAMDAFSVIDSAAIVNWPSLGQCAISNNGKYFMYTIDNKPKGATTFIIKSTEDNWEKHLINIRNPLFSPDSKEFFFQSNDTLCFLLLGTDQVTVVDKTISYSLPETDKKEWLAYLSEINKHELTLYNLVSNKKNNFTGVTNYSFSPNGKSILLQTQNINEKLLTVKLIWVDLTHKNVKTIWSSSANADNLNPIIAYQFNEQGNQLAFITGDTTLWYYSAGSANATIKLSNKSAIKATGLSMALEAPDFSSNSGYIFFSLQSPLKSERKLSANAGQVDIWTYRDSILPFKQSTQSANVYKAAINVKSEKIVRVEEDNEKTETISKNGDFAIVTHGYKYMLQIDYWWPSCTDQYQWLHCLKDGSRKKLASIFEWGDIQFSPDNNYLIFYDYTKNIYCSYQISTGKIQKISGSINGACFLTSVLTYPFRAFPHALFGTAGWLANENAVLIYDQYDIWQLDINGQKRPINLTNSAGRSQDIQFRIIYDYTKKNRSIEPAILLSAFDTKNKYSGIYKLSLEKKRKLEKLVLGPYTLQYVTKALDKDTWIIRRETAEEAPNYYFSSGNLKTYKPLSSLQPQKAYNWLTTELVTWKQLDGTFSQGILYKPLNFDSTKKYPLIFQYYEEKSQNMYRYIQPEFANGEMDIPWYVSRGYLVFTPDIHYGVASVTNKVNGDYAVNAVVSAANYLAKRSYVDAERMGLQGHSFGGGETLYLVTHSNIFAAACAAASTVSNEITAYLGIVRSNGKLVSGKMFHSEVGHNKIGATLWQRPDLYIKASPVFRADSVTTPLLLMHNLGDGQCDFNQSAEMFMALRRLGKKVWLLRYGNGAHTLKDIDAVDYTIRMQQFFDHYLKGVSAPAWMKSGITPNLKDAKTGSEQSNAYSHPYD